MKKIYALLLTTTVVSAEYTATDSEDVSATYDSNTELVLNQKTPTEAILGTSSVLYDNGPFITSVGTGVGGEDESVLQTTSLGMNILGAGAQLVVGTTDNRVADDFVVTGAGWQVDEIVVYAYQTGAVASTITTVSLQIWDGDPSDPASMVVFGDPTTDRLSMTGNSGVLRVTEESTGTIDNRQITFNQVTIDTFLPAGTYWIDYQFTGSAASGPWAPPITIIGQTTTGNGLQQINTTSPDWIPYEDSGTLTQQGFPFLVLGSDPDLIFADNFDVNIAPL